MASGDIDGDGAPDLVCGSRQDTGRYYNRLVWFRNPGNAAGNWIRTTIGAVDFTIDHLKVADFDGDGRNEVLVSEGRSPEAYPAGIYHFTPRGGASQDTNWHKKQLTIQHSTNSLEVADLDQDGDLDFVAGEHKGRCRLQFWKNDSEANFTCHTIDSLKESHNGALLLDIEGDGDLDIATSGWYDRKVHVWINTFK
jgi:hypothetical protein